MVSLKEVKEEQRIALISSGKHWFIDVDSSDYDIFLAFDTLYDALDYLCLKLVKLPDFSLKQLLETGYIEWRG